MSEEYPSDADVDEDEDGDIDAAIEVARVLALGEKYLAEAECANGWPKREELAYRQSCFNHKWRFGWHVQLP